MQWCLKMIIYHDKGGFSITSENLIDYINEIRDKIYVTILTDEDNVFDNVHPLFIIC